MHKRSKNLQQYSIFVLNTPNLIKYQFNYCIWYVNKVGSENSRNLEKKHFTSRLFSHLFGWTIVVGLLKLFLPKMAQK